MASSQHEHTRARREALQVMYQSELTGAPLSELLDGTGDEGMLLIPEIPEGTSEKDLIGVPLVGYAKELLEGTLAHLDDIDDLIIETARNWSIDRMPIVDRNIIRIAAYEIVYRDDIPTGVAINEAVEIAKAFGGDDSPKFVNGVLGMIARRVGENVPEGEAEAEAETEAEAEAAPEAEAAQAAPEKPAEEQAAEPSAEPVAEMAETAGEA